MYRKIFMSLASVLIISCFQLNTQCFSQGVSINKSGLGADASAILDISSSSTGLLIPRMTTSDRNAISSPALSLLIFNTTTNCFEAYVNGIWYSVSCPPPCSSPSSPVAGSSVPSSGSIVWNWGSVSGANAYKWSTANNYLSAIDNGSVTSYTQSGLKCNTGYSSYVWAYNSCGNSSPLILSQVTSACITFCPGWQKNFANASEGFAGGETTDGGFFISGVEYEWDNYVYNDLKGDFYLYKLDSKGNSIWGKTYGGVGTDQPYTAHQTSDGGFIMAGFTGSFGFTNSNQQFFLVKTDRDGNLSWSYSYGGSGQYNIPFSVRQTNDGGFIAAGYTNGFGFGIQNIYVVKTNTDGTLAWSKTYGGTNYDQAFSITLTNDGGYIIAGSTSSYGLYYTYCNLTKIDGSGNLQWSKVYKNGNIDYGQTNGYAAYQTSDGGYIIGGNSYQLTPDGWGGKYMLIKTLSDGTVSWSKSYGGSYVESLQSLQITPDGGYVMNGSSLRSFDKANHWDYYLLKTDANGVFQMGNVYSGIPNDTQGWGVALVSDGGYLLTGLTNLDLFLPSPPYPAGFLDYPNCLFSYVIKTDASGNAGGCYTFSAASTVTTNLNISVINYTSQVKVTNPATNAVNQTSNTIVGTHTPTVNILCSNCK
jgi:hypothetical protein